MSNTTFIVREKSGVNHISLTPSFKAGATRFGVIDGALLVGFVVAFMGLVFLLAK